MDRGAAGHEWRQAAVDAPHSAIDGTPQGEIINLTDGRADRSRAAQLELLADLGPDGIVQEFAKLTGERQAQPLLPHLVMPQHHDVRASDVFTRRLHGTLAAAAERGPVDFPELLLRQLCARGRCNRSPWWPKSCMAHLTALAILQDFLLRMVAKIATPKCFRHSLRF